MAQISVFQLINGDLLESIPLTDIIGVVPLNDNTLINNSINLLVLNPLMGQSYLIS